MSIVDDFRCKQDWGPGGYKFEVVLNKAPAEDFVKVYFGTVFDKAMAKPASDPFFKHSDFTNGV